ncbi:hypothetical protein QZH41_010915, partial [Actinostola sp. cb2023]
MWNKDRRKGNGNNQARDLFNDEIGTLPGEVKLTVIEDATPVVCPPKRLPVEIKDQVKEELDKLVKIGVIDPVDHPTDWVNQMTVATKKSGELRICLDPRSLNKVLKREHYQLPVLEDTLHDLAKAKLFSKLDLKHGYWHCVLDEPSSILTTFATPFGRYEWKRLPFRLSVSSEIFQKRLIQALEGLPSTTPIADDILLYGKGEHEKDAEKDHDDNLTKLLERCQEKGIRLNKGKAVLKVKQLDFMGHFVTAEGLKPDPNKVEAIVKLQTPTDKQGVERLNGAVNYLAKFLLKLSQVMAPIRQLTHKDVEWHWDAVQDRAFEEIKQLVTQAPVLAYYDPQKELVIQCDASSKGLGAVFLQEERPVAYASRCLIDAETRYATIEKEMLAVVFALEKWHQFTYGRAVQVCTDHKPLVSINQKSLDKAPRRLQGMLLRSLNYNIDIQYRQGDRLVIPKSMRKSIKKELHSSHSGIDGCLRRARESVYWPGMSSEIKEWISTCETCREYETAQPKEPLMSHEIPERPWEKVGIDILTLQGTDYLVTVDYYSNYWEIDRLENTKSATAIRKLKAHFARFGIPSRLVSDNGAQFTSDSFRKFTRDWDIEHTPSAPYNSQSNGKAEAAVKAAKKMLRKTQKTREDQYLALLAIRNTPSQGIGRSPIQRIMNRRTRTLLPTTDTLLTPKTVERETEITRIKDQQERQAFYFNRDAHKLTPLQQGD